MNRKPLLTILAVITISIFFVMPANRVWLTDRIVYYAGSMKSDWNHMHPEYRRQLRYGNSYTLAKDIAVFLEERKERRKALVLMPPESYFKQKGISFPVPEPVVFYYYTGVKTVWANSREASKSSWYVSAENGMLQITMVGSAQELNDIINTYNQFDYPL